MKKNRIISFFAFCMGFMNMALAQYTNPVIDNSLPDPSIIKAQDGYFYLLATEDWHNVPIYRSHNLVDWKFMGTAFTDETRPKWLDGGAVWAPDINYINGKYVMYYSLSKWGENNNNGIGVAVADRPEGPYTAPSDNPSGKLFTSSEIGVTNSIDPFFIADGGRNYLFWGSFNGIYCIELSADGLSVKSGASKTKVINNTVEASSIIKHDGYYYFIGSAGSCCEGENSTYKLVVARSTSLTSGYKNKSGQSVQSDGLWGIGQYDLTDMLTRNTEVIGPGHCSEIVQDNNGDYWFVYHGYDANDVYAGRQVFLSQVKWGNDGWPYIEGGHPAISNNTAPDLPSIHEISNGQELLSFAQMVNEGNGHVDAVLTADIDMSGIDNFPGIGNDGNNLKRFHATFDGQGHRIKNLHMTGDCVALFPVASDNTVIKNLIIDSSCSFTGTGRNAAFVSACNWDEWGSKKVEFYNCGNEATVTGDGGNCGAFLGCNYDGDIAIVMRNCYNTGNITGGWETAALSGWIGNNGNSRIDHCFNTGTVTGMDGSQNNLFRGTAGGKWFIDNCYDTNYDHNCPKVDGNTVASGELCFLLNQGQPEMQWYQTLGTDSHPIPVSTSQPVYCTGNWLCDGTTTGVVTFSNTNDTNYDPHQFSAADDLCDRCQAGRKPAQVDGVYQISSIGNLVWFSEAVNSGFGVNYNAALTTDINQGRAVYTPIGNTAYPYQGQFDGQTHSVTLSLDNGGYDYQGIFGVITDGVTIKNLVARGTIKGKSYVGGIAGGTNGGSNNAKKTTLENCGNEATVSATDKNAGAMIGVNLNGSASFIFRNCYNVGAINGPTDVGAFSGWSGGGWSQFYNCYNAGKVNGGGSADFSRNNGTGFNNCYYVEGCNNNSRDAAGQLEAVTSAQLAYGGNLLGKLNTNGTYWYQDKYDAYPLPFGHPLEVELNEASTVAPTSYTSVDVTVLRSINAGNWSTIVLPFAIPADKMESVFGAGVVVRDFTGYDYDAVNDHITVNFSEVSAMEANHPYIIKVGTAISSFTVENVDITPSKDPRVKRGTTSTMKDFAGTYVANFNFFEAATNTPLYISGNQFWYASAQTLPMKAFRAYFDFSDDHVAASRIQMSFDEATGVNDAKSNTDEIRGEVYDLQGRRVVQPQKGLYIVNGKKVVIRSAMPLSSSKK